VVIYAAFQPQNEDESGSEHCVYLTGNSLGLQAKKSHQYVEEEMDKWKRIGVMGHLSGDRPWLTIDEEATKLMATVVGALPTEVALMTTLTTNLHLLMVPFYRPTASRFKILIESGAFPSDLYCTESQALVHGYDPKDAVVRLEPRAGERTLRTEDVIKTIESNSFALILLPGVQYETGQFLDMEAITKAGHKSGARVGFDLAHGAGNVTLKLHEWQVDFAAWCSYKYLNSGPGGIGGLFFHERHHNDPSLHKFSGWWGHQLTTRFQMKHEFEEIPGAFAFRLSNPSVLPIVSLLATLEIMNQVGFENMANKQRILTGYMEALLRTELGEKYVSIVTPADPTQRGCQLSLDFHRNAKDLEHQLYLRGIVADARDTIIRAAPTPLYNSYSDVRRFVDVLKEILLK
jgi:kynureninase